jgi:RluA family pseudouridine synthase
MQEKRSNKVPPKKYQPKGLAILYEDQYLIVVDKVQGLLTIGTDREKEKTAHFILNEYVKRGNERSRNRIYIVHRLDRETSGVLIFAKNERIKEYLQEGWKEFSKTYAAVVHGKLVDKEGVIASYLLENKAFRVYSTNDTVRGKYSETGYRVIKESGKFSLLEVELYTGRKHQIRVHLSEEGHPVVGDRIYGPPDKEAKRLALHAVSLTIIHPVTHKEICFETEIPPYLRTLVNY